MNTKRRIAGIVAVLFAGVLTYVLGWRGIVLSHANAADDSPYGDELCSARSQPDPQEPSRTWTDPAPGRHYRGQPRGRYLALTRDAVRDYHTIFVWDEQAHALKAVISVQEMDPGSGSSHDYRWSQDQRALLIYGAGKLPFQSHPAELSYAYVPEEDSLYGLPTCGARALGENAAQQ